MIPYIQNKIGTLLLFCLFIAPAFGQEKSESSLLEADNLYKSGRIDQSLVILKKQMADKSSFNKRNRNQRAEFYHLATHCYILMDKPDSAEFYLIKMLKIWPDYTERRALPDDLERFKLSTDQLFALPKFQVGIQFGSNYSYFEELSHYDIVYVNDNNPVLSHSSSNGYQFHFLFEYDFWRYMSFSFEPGLTSFRHLYEKAYVTDINAEDDITYTEKIRYIDFIFFGNLKLFPRSKNRITISLGANQSFLSTATREIQGSKAASTIASSLNWYNYALMGRIGYSRRFYNFSVGIDFTGAIYNRKINNPQARFINDPQSTSFIYGYHSVPDDLKFKTVQMNISLRYFLNYNIYK